MGSVKIIFRIPVLCLILSSGIAHGVPSSGESYLFYARQYLSRFVDDTLQKSNGSLNAIETDLLTKISRSYPHELHFGKLEFKDPDANPKLFEAGGSHRLAVTGNKVGDPIYVNSKLAQNLSFEEALGILIHEFAHHQGVKDDPQRSLDQLAAKVRAAAQITATPLTDAKLGNWTLTRFKLSSYPKGPTETPRGPQDFEPVNPADTGLGDHALLSDGNSVVDLRSEMRYQRILDGGQVLDFKVDTTQIQRDDKHLRIGLEYSAFRNRGYGDNVGTLEWRIPLETSSQGHVLFSSTKLTTLTPKTSSVKDAYDQLAHRRPPADKIFPVEQLSLTSNSDHLKAGERWELEATFKSPVPVENINLVLFRPSEVPELYPLVRIEPISELSKQGPRHPQQGPPSTYFEEIAPQTYKMKYSLQTDWLSPGPVHLFEIRIFDKSYSMGSLRPTKELSTHVEGNKALSSPAVITGFKIADQDLLKSQTNEIELPFKDLYTHAPVEIHLSSDQDLSSFDSGNVSFFGKGIGESRTQTIFGAAHGSSFFEGDNGIHVPQDKPKTASIHTRSVIYSSPFEPVRDKSIQLHGVSMRARDSFHEKVVKFEKPIVFRKPGPPKTKIIWGDSVPPACARTIEDLIDKLNDP